MDNLDNLDNMEIGNTKRSPLRRNWCFTWNNYPEDWFNILEVGLDNKKHDYVYGEEVGENGTPHIQGCIKFKNSVRIETLKKIDLAIHFEFCRSWAHSVEYCLKDGKFRTNLKGKEKPEDELLEYELLPWQIEVLDIIKEKPDRRKIHWYWEEVGGVGKTVLAKHICMNYNAQYVNGKGADVKCALASLDEMPNIVIYDYPRSVENYVSYGSIEEVKNGIMFSGKYESKTRIFNKPHVFIFANFHPDVDKLSKDRWHIVKIDEIEDEVKLDT